MNLQNGYKVIYDKATEGKRAFYASQTGMFADAEQIGEDFEIGKYKLIYEKDGSIYGSETGIPAEGDHCFEEFNKVFVAEDDEVVEVPAAEPVVEPIKEEPEVTNETPANVEDPEVDETEE
jgi:hypothetical protein